MRKLIPSRAFVFYVLMYANARTGRKIGESIRNERVLDAYGRDEQNGTANYR